MPDPTLEDVLLALFSEPELRAWFDRLGLGPSLPGAGVTREQLCHDAAGVLDRRGRIDAALLGDVAAQAGTRRPLVETVARAHGVTLPAATKPRPTRATSTRARANAAPTSPGSNMNTSRGPRARVGPSSRVSGAPADTAPPEDPKLRDLRALIEKGQVVVIVGAGVSLAATGGAPTAGWKGLLRAGVEHCRNFGHADDKWCKLRLHLLDEGDVSDWIHVAGQITDKLGGAKGGEFRGWLRASFEPLKATDTSLHQAIAALGCPIATTNYDHLLEAATGLRPVSWDEESEVERVLRGDEPGILHLHGHWKRPESVVLGVESYLGVRDAPHARAVREALRTTKSLLFIGCGDTTEDSNIGAWLRWSGEVLSRSEYRSYRLERDGDVAALQAKHPPAQRLYVLGYGPEHRDLPGFVRRLAPRQPEPEDD